MNMQPIPTFVISSQTGAEKENVLKTFSHKDEFELNFTEPIVDKSDTNEFWQIVQQIVQVAVDRDYDYFLLCKDDHLFTNNYSKEDLFDCISQAKQIGSDILCGDARWFSSAIRVSKKIFWVESFPDSSFTIIFSSLFSGILAEGDKIFSVTNRMFFIYPFMSYPSGFEQEDSRSENFQTNIKDTGFEVSQKVELLDYVSKFYEDLSNENEGQLSIEDFDNIAIPTYIINLPERTERLEHIQKQFAGRQEFDIKIIEACRNRIGAVGLWETIRMIIEMAIDNEDDVIIICEDDHEFTNDYSKSYLLKNIMEAYLQQAEMLLGGICGFKRALPISDNRVWVNYSHCLQFTILYKPVFQKILDEPYNNKVIPDILLSDLVINKMVLYPFISIQRYFGYSDVSKLNHEDKEMVATNFAWANDKLKKIYGAKAAFINKLQDHL